MRGVGLGLGFVDGGVVFGLHVRFPGVVLGDGRAVIADVKDLFGAFLGLIEAFNSTFLGLVGSDDGAFLGFVGGLGGAALGLMVGPFGRVLDGVGRCWWRRPWCRCRRCACPGRQSGRSRAPTGCRPA